MVVMSRNCLCRFNTDQPTLIPTTHRAPRLFVGLSSKISDATSAPMINREVFLNAGSISTLDISPVPIKLF